MFSKYLQMLGTCDESGELQNPFSVRQFGNMFWQRVRIMMLSVPEADDFDTQVGLMLFVLMDVYVLCLQETSEVRSYLRAKHL